MSGRVESSSSVASESTRPLGLLRVVSSDSSTAGKAHVSTPSLVPGRSLASLPDSLLLLVLGLVDLRSLLSVRRTSQEMFLLSYDHALYHHTGLRRLQRLMVAPPSMRHLRGIFCGSGGGFGGPPPSLPLLGALDVTRMSHAPNGVEFYPADAFRAIRLLKIRDQSLLYDLRGLEHLAKVFGARHQDDLRDAIIPRAGRTTRTHDPSTDNFDGLHHLLVYSRWSDSFEHDSSIGYSSLGSSLAFPPLPSSIPARGSTSTHADATTHAGTNSRATLQFEYTDVHLHLIGTWFTGLRTLVLPLTSCHFSSVGLGYLRYLPFLRTLSIGVHRVADDLPALCVGHTLESFTFFVRSLIHPAHNRRTGAASATTNGGHRPRAIEQRRRSDAMSLTDGGDGDIVALADVFDRQNAFHILSRHFAHLRTLAVHVGQLHSEEGLADITADDLRRIAEMTELTQLKIAKIETPTIKDAPQLKPGLLRAAVHMLSDMIDPRSSEPTSSRSPAHLRHLLHGSCLSSLRGCTRLRKLQLEGCSLFSGALAAWRGARVSHTLTSLTCVRCDFVAGALPQLACLVRLRYLELQSCRVAGAAAVQEMIDEFASLPDAPLEELILHHCIDARGADPFLTQDNTAAMTHRDWHATVHSPVAVSSPLRALTNLINLKTLYIAFSATDAPPYNNKEMALTQELVSAHLAAIGDLLSSPACRLQSLTFANCAFTTAAAWQNFIASAIPSSSDDCSASPSPPHRSSLTALDVSSCVGLTDEVIAGFGRAFARLARVDLSYARREGGKVPHSDGADTGGSIGGGGEEMEFTAAMAAAALEEECARDLAPSSSPPPHAEPASQSDPLPRATTPDSLADDGTIDAAVCSYSLVGLHSLLRSCPPLRSLRVLCHSPADAANFIEPPARDAFHRIRPDCLVVASRWQ